MRRGTAASRGKACQSLLSKVKSSGEDDVGRLCGTLLAIAGC